MVLDGFDHDGVLQRRSWNLHSPGTADRRMRDVAITGNLIAGVDNHDALLKIVRQDASDFSQHRRLSDSRSTKQQDALSGLYEIADDPNCPVDSAPNTAGQSNNVAAPIADSRDAMKRPLNTCTIIISEAANSIGDKREVVASYFTLRQESSGVLETSLGTTPQVEDDLDQSGIVARGVKLTH
jgi:hypothetical protein